MTDMKKGLALGCDLEIELTGKVERNRDNPSLFWC